jgi:hypothetical protein
MNEIKKRKRGAHVRVLHAVGMLSYRGLAQLPEHQILLNCKWLLIASPGLIFCQLGITIMCGILLLVAYTVIYPFGPYQGVSKQPRFSSQKKCVARYENGTTILIDNSKAKKLGGKREYSRYENDTKPCARNRCFQTNKLQHMQDHDWIK